MNHEMRIDIIASDMPGFYWVVPNDDSEASQGCWSHEVGALVQQLFDDRSPK